MRNQYIIELKKDGYMKYISHLDMIKLFKNSFKKAGIKLAYSQGFNPHPKMGFAQPLSLGYSSTCELLEFETKESLQTHEILELLQGNIPKGIEIFGCKNFTNKRSFAARSYAATYEITIPIEASFVQKNNIQNQSLNEICEDFMKQDKIVALKRQKKTGKSVAVDIKGMIRSIAAILTEDPQDNTIHISSEKQSQAFERSKSIVLTVTLDSGSNSNLSPELLLAAFTAFANIDVDREDVEVKRTGLFFYE